VKWTDADSCSGGVVLPIPQWLKVSDRKTAAMLHQHCCIITSRLSTYVLLFCHVMEYMVATWHCSTFINCSRNGCAMVTSPST